MPGGPVFRRYPASYDDGPASVARVGLIALASDHTAESELRSLVERPGVALYTTRIANDPVVTPQSLRAMEAGLTDAAARLLPGVEFDVIAYGCTSASTVIGEDVVADRVRAAKPGVAIATPIGAARAALAALGARSVAVLTPYTDDVNVRIHGHLVDHGITVTAFGSFHDANDNSVARIDAGSIAAAARALAAAAGTEAVFISCTSIRFAAQVPALEATLGLPVITSNTGLAWSILRQAGVDEPEPDKGRLFALPYPDPAP
ncbi:MAG: Asp/Glu racemase [Alphaproteobacteria bacterium]|nr:Asp/Glu racemase [Alphaproteobacteria bacterium]